MILAKTCYNYLKAPGTNPDDNTQTSICRTGGTYIDETMSLVWETGKKAGFTSNRFSVFSRMSILSSYVWSE